ncbi:hypothetical protein AGIG_G16579 [Arapaima gigas]
MWGNSFQRVISRVANPFNGLINDSYANPGGLRGGAADTEPVQLLCGATKAKKKCWSPRRGAIGPKSIVRCNRRSPAKGERAPPERGVCWPSSLDSSSSPVLIFGNRRHSVKTSPEMRPEHADCGRKERLFWCRQELSGG